MGLLFRIVRKTIFAIGEIYHVFNLGVERRPTFMDKRERDRALLALNFYRFKKISAGLAQVLKLDLEKRNFFFSQLMKQKDKLVDIIGYCLMPNHFHLIARQIENAGISFFMRRSLDSYTRYYNARHNRVGPIFQGKFKAVLIENDEQLIHLSRYVHLNPFVEDLIDTPNSYRWSSYKCYLSGQSSRICSPDFVVKLVGSAAEYRKFVTDYASYAQSIATIKHSLINEF